MPPTARKKSSTATKLVQAAALAAVLVPLGAVAVETSSITCSYSGGPNFCSGGSLNNKEFDFRQFGSGSPYKVILDFDTLTGGSFDITITDTQVTGNPTLSGRLPPGFVCVPIANGTTTCVEFSVADSSSGSGWTGFFDIYFNWDPDTENLGFANGPGNRVRVMHDNTGEAYFDITDPNQPYTTSILGDPGIGGRDNNFQDFTIAYAPAVIPEPATLLLLGSGVTGLMYRRRRRRKDR